MRNKRIQHIFISVFVICWSVIFHYESLRAFYLAPFFEKPLPKIKFLFPPAGWIMFYNVDDSYALAEVYGIKEGKPQLIDPHEILRTRTIMFDNIHRNVLSTVLRPQLAPSVCRYLHYRFPYFDEFIVVQAHYPSLIKERYQKEQQVLYRCQDEK